MRAMFALLADLEPERAQTSFVILPSAGLIAWTIGLVAVILLIARGGKRSYGESFLLLTGIGIVLTPLAQLLWIVAVSRPRAMRARAALG